MNTETNQESFEGNTFQNNLQNQGNTVPLGAGSPELSETNNGDFQPRELNSIFNLLYLLTIF